MTFTSPLELSVSNQGAFNVSHVSGRSALIMICFVILTTKKAKKKPLAKKTAEELGVDLTPRHEVLSVEDPPTRTAGQKVETVEELVKKLKDMGLV